MGLFERFRGRDKKSDALAARLASEPAPRLLTTPVTPLRERLLEIRRADDVEALLSLYATTPPPERVALLDAFVDDGYLGTPEAVDEARTWLERWLAALGDADDPTRTLLRGVLLRTLGWTYRGRGKITGVDETDKEAYWALNVEAMDRLAEAGDALFEAGDVSAHVWAQRSTDSWTSEQKYQLAQQWRAVDPWHRLGLAALQRQIDERWGGGDWEWFELAHHIAHEAPPGSSALGLVAVGAVYRWAYLVYFADENFDDADQKSLKLPQVQAILRLAYDKLFRADAPHSEPARRLEDLNHFMWACFYGDVDDVALDALRRLDGAVSEEVWGSLREDDPIEEFTRARDWLIAEVELA